MRVGRNRALFLDRDGVISVDTGYSHRRESFEFIPGIFQLRRAAQRLGLTRGRGYQPGGNRARLLLRVRAQRFDGLDDNPIAEKKVSITRLYYRPYHPVFFVDKV